MASKTSARAFQSLTRQARQKCTCAASTSSRSKYVRQFSSSTSRPEEVPKVEEQEYRPRWSYTPPQMKLPFDPRAAEYDTPEFVCNDDPAKLDRFYIKFLGRGGNEVLTDEVKWLAITHKSFDQGRRGFNDRLAYLGRRVVNMQTSLALLQSPVPVKAEESQDEREPYTHPALEGLPNLSNTSLEHSLGKKRLASLASQMGMVDIIRWVPRLRNDLEASGLEVVLATSMYAIIGAIALQKGGAVAARVTRERILKPLGIA
ncbi:RNAse III domain protein [Rutstroemia sp. NJR-2017a BVV2]|nr:RNAse III domain protein [Rutstroemia sp. NJR-2017a BVV2]